MEDDYNDDLVECSYCGASLYVDAASCGKCGNFTDGLGPRACPERAGSDKRPLAKKWVVTGWVVLLAFVCSIFYCKVRGLF